MTSKTLRVLVRTAVVLVAICGVTACFYFLPALGKDLASMFPEYAHCYYPWLIFLWIAAAPCFAFLALVWKLSAVMKQNLVFTYHTAHMVKTSAIILFCNVGFFVAGNIVLLMLHMNHPFVLLLSIIIAIFGLVLGVVVAMLSRYLTKGAALQEEADSTI